MRRVFLVAALLGIALISAGTAHAAFPGQNGRIAVQAPDGLHLVDPDGSVVSALVGDRPRNNRYLSEPNFSPDGEHVAFIQSISPNRYESHASVWTVRTDGTERTRISPGYGSSFDADGNVVFTRGGEFYAAEPDGSNVRPIDQTRLGVLSPVRDELAFTEIRFVIGNEVFVANRDGTGERRLTRTPDDVNVFATDFLPSGNEVAFLRWPETDYDRSEAELWAVDTNGVNERRLIANLPDLPISDAQISPDGRRVVAGDYTMGLDGTNRRRLQVSGLTRGWGPASQPRRTGSCSGQPATIVGTSLDDRIRGTRGRDVIQAGRGNDVILGGKRADRICGGAGDDVIKGHKGPDRLVGGLGNDVLRGNQGRDALFGGKGFDRCFGGKGPDTARCEQTKSA